MVASDLLSNNAGIILQSISYFLQSSLFLIDLVRPVVETVIISVILGRESPGCLGLRLRIMNRSIAIPSAIALVAVTLLVLVVVSSIRVSSSIRIHRRPLSAVTLATIFQLIRVGVLGQSVVGVDSLVGVASEDSTQEGTALFTIAGGVVVLRAGSKALLLAVVALKSDLHKNGEDEEEAVYVSELN